MKQQVNLGAHEMKRLQNLFSMKVEAIRIRQRENRLKNNETNVANYNCKVYN